MKEIKAMTDRISHLQLEIENYKKIKRNEKLEVKFQSQDLLSQSIKDLKLENFIPTKLIYKILDFLPHHDIITFRAVNKLAYNCMSFDYRFYSLLLQKIRFQQKSEIQNLQKKLDYFKSLADKIPEEYLKASLIKFLSLQEKFGDYLPPILHKSKKVFDYEETLPNSTAAQITVPNPEEEIKKRGSFGGNLIKKMMGISKTPEGKPKVMEKASVQDINDLVGKLMPQMNITVDMDFLKQIQNDRSQTIKQVEVKAIN